MTTEAAEQQEALTEQRAREQKERVAGVFHRAAATYEQVGPNFFGPWAERLLDRAALSPGSRVLDIATGRGAVLIRAAERVGPEGHVTGVDLAQGMVDSLAADVLQRGIANAAVRQMDAENLDLPEGSFDAVTCGFGLMFFPNIPTALAGFRRVLRPGGTLALSYLPEDATRDPRWDWRDGLAKEFSPPSPQSGRPEWSSLTAPKNADQLRDAVEAAGFGAVVVDEDRTELRFADPNEYWDWTWSHGARGLYERMDAPTLDRYKQRLFEQLDALHAKGELAQNLRALFLTAHRPV